MTLKQRLAELLPHFDENGNILPNRQLKFDATSFTIRGVPTLKFVLAAIAKGTEVTVEDLPKRPRRWDMFLTDSGQLSPCSTYLGGPFGKLRHFPPITVIEDTPREVTDALFHSCERVFKHSTGHWGIALRAALQHYENERNK